MTGRLAATAYVATVAGLASYGFTSESTAAILLAAALALPAGLPALVSFYLGYGLLAQVPGANPSDVTGSSCNAAGCTSSITGGLAPWFAVTTDALGVLALTGAALAQVLFVRLLVRSRRNAGPA